MISAAIRRPPITGLHLRHFTVLALESSADDTCAAVVASSGEILSNVVVKQNHV
jgi:N6-L-threonylcarbamoyladenine synthase